MTETEANPVEELIRQKDAEINDLHLVIGEQTVKMRRQFEYINRLERVVQEHQKLNGDLQAQIAELSPEPEQEEPESESAEETEVEEEGEEK